MMADEDRPSPPDHVARKMQAWLQHIPGCRFVAPLTAQKRVHYGQVDPTTSVDTLDALLVACGQKDMAAALLFPTVEDEQGLVAAILRLCESDRWNVSVAEEGALDLVALTWMTESGLPSDVMGLAPLLTMPVFRRAPYCAVAVWPGSARRENSTSVNFGDMPSPDKVDQARHKVLVRESRHAIKEMAGSFPEALPWRTNAFRLSREHTALLRD